MVMCENDYVPKLKYYYHRLLRRTLVRSVILFSLISFHIKMAYIRKLMTSIQRNKLTPLCFAQPNF